VFKEDVTQMQQSGTLAINKLKMMWEEYAGGLRSAHAFLNNGSNPACKT